MDRASLISLRIVALLAACVGLVWNGLGVQDAQAQAAPTAPAAEWQSVFDGKSLQGWELAKGYDYEDQGKVAVTDGCLVLEAGQPATGVRWTGAFPRANYEVELEGQRVSGDDFFCGMSFPVGDNSLTLILGGWGGSVCGLSCVDGYRAADNETASARSFENGKWYRIRVTVTDAKITAYINDKMLCAVRTEERKLKVTNEMAPCLPFGFATWNTTGALKNIRYRSLGEPATTGSVVRFQKAQPVWPAGRSREMNLTTGFRAIFDSPVSGNAKLKIAASTVYRAWLNGKFLALGPARGPHGYFRMDELDLSPYLRDEQNVLAIEVAGYNVNSYDILDQPSFLQAEVESDGDRILAATGDDDTDFVAVIPAARRQKVQRYSFQRPFIEMVRLTPHIDAWRTSLTHLPDPVDLETVDAKRILPRRVLMPRFEVQHPLRQLGQGQLIHQDPPANPWKDRSLVNITPEFKGFPEAELEAVPSLEIQAYKTQPGAPLAETYTPAAPIQLAAGEYRILDLGTNLTGMLGGTLECSAPTRCWFVFDEILTDGDVDFKRLGCVNLVSFELEPGRYDVETIEPYTLRYLKLICVEGSCSFSNVFMREYKHPAPEVASFTCSDEQLNTLYRAGIETFRQNTLDIFMDCPSRERAGWLCDSYFTSRVAKDLTGTTVVEQAFYENFLLPERFEHLPPGMLPMCYPSDHNDGVFIPNWSLWFVVQLEEYLARSGDRATVDALRGKVLQLFDYFAKLENSDGLLEKLQGWVFVEWSAANEYVQDVNYPSNMLYAGALSAASRLYKMPELEAKAEKLRATIRQQSFDGHFFVDNALRTDGKVQVTKNHSEVCQYFAFQFDVASPQTHPELWQLLRDKFGPDRKQTKAYWDEVRVANSFIGNMLRFELLSRFGCQQQILDESTAYLLYMAERTGTLWENDGAYASCNHGFASHIVHTLYRDVLGVTRVDIPHKLVTVRLPNVKLDSCSGCLPTPEGPVRLKWHKQGDNELRYSLQVPEGYQVEIENATGKQVTAEDWKD